jgi:hypothetical protein
MDRATERLRRDEVEAMVLRNVEEIRHWLNHVEQIALGQCVGRASKAALVADANLLHDWRVGMNVSAGGAGAPHLWQVRPTPCAAQARSFVPA